MKKRELVTATDGENTWCVACEWHPEECTCNDCPTVDAPYRQGFDADNAVEMGFVPG